MVAAAVCNLDLGIDTDVVNNSPTDWLDLQQDYNLDQDGSFMPMMKLELHFHV